MSNLKQVSVDVVKKLLEYRADLNATNVDGHTALAMFLCHFNLDSGGTNMRKLMGKLMGKDCNVLVRDKRGRSLVELAMACNEVDFAPNLLCCLKNLRVSIA